MIHANFDYQRWNFPGGEVGIKIDKLCKDLGLRLPEIFWIYETSKLHDDFFVLANIIDACKRIGVTPRVRIPYLPYARQDRVCHEGESFALKVFLDMLFTLEAEFVFYDVHSNVVKDIQESKHDSNVTYLTQYDCYKSLLFCYISILKYNYDLIVAPDKGATEKAKKIHSVFYPEAKLLYMNKVRTENGVRYEPLQTNINGARILVLDDICDGGATFIALADTLKEQATDCDLHLYVTHGLFSKGLDELNKRYSQIFCYNLINRELEIPYCI